MTTLSIKIENDLKKAAHKIAESIGVSLSGLIKMLLKNTVRSGKLYINTKPRYHSEPEDGDLDFSNLKEAAKYFEKLANEDGKIT